MKAHRVEIWQIEKCDISAIYAVASSRDFANSTIDILLKYSRRRPELQLLIRLKRIIQHLRHLRYFDIFEDNLLSILLKCLLFYSLSDVLLHLPKAQIDFGSVFRFKKRRRKMFKWAFAHGRSCSFWTAHFVDFCFSAAFYFSWWNSTPGAALRPRSRMFTISSRWLPLYSAVSLLEEEAELDCMNNIGTHLLKIYLRRAFRGDFRIWDEEKHCLEILTIINFNHRIVDSWSDKYRIMAGNMPRYYIVHGGILIFLPPNSPGPKAFCLSGFCFPSSCFCSSKIFQM